MFIRTLLFLAAAVQTVKVDQPLRAGCSESDPVVATLHAGDRVQIKFALAGAAQECVLVSATVDGKTVEGNVPASMLTGIEEFDRARREAAPVSVPAGGPAPKPAEAPMPAVKSSSPEMDRAMDLLQRNQPQQALEILEKFLKLFPKNPDLLSLAGTAAYKSDNMRLALQYWGESLDLKPDPQLRRAYEAAKHEAASDKSGEKKYGTRFLLRYDGAVADSDTARVMVAVLEEEFTRVSAQLGCRAEERIVTIVQSRDAYRQATGAPEWSGGGYDGKIRIPLVRQPGPETRRVFAHEIVHACLANIGPWPAWLHEGLAQKLSGDTLQPAAAQLLKAVAKAGKLPKLNELGQTWGGKSTQAATLAYSEALAGVELFYQYHAEFGIRNLLNNPEALPRVTADLDKRLQEQ